VERDVLDLVVGLDAGRVVRGVEILLDLGLPVRHELRAGVLADVEVEEVRAAVGDAGLRVDVSLDVHPLRDFVAAGVIVTINSDDPPMFGTTLNREYELAAEMLGLDRAGVVDLASAAVGASFAEDSVKTRLLTEIQAYADR